MSNNTGVRKQQKTRTRIVKYKPQFATYYLEHYQTQTKREIAEVFGISYITLISWIKKNNWPNRDVRFKDNNTKVVRVSDQKDVIEYYKENISFKTETEIASDLSISLGRLQKVKRDNNIKVVKRQDYYKSRKGFIITREEFINYCSANQDINKKTAALGLRVTQDTYNMLCKRFINDNPKYIDNKATERILKKELSKHRHTYLYLEDKTQLSRYDINLAIKRIEYKNEQLGWKLHDHIIKKKETALLFHNYYVRNADINIPVYQLADAFEITEQQVKTYLKKEKRLANKEKEKRLQQWGTKTTL